MALCECELAAQWSLPGSRCREGCAGEGGPDFGGHFARGEGSDTHVVPLACDRDTAVMV